MFSTHSGRIVVIVVVMSYLGGLLGKAVGTHIAERIVNYKENCLGSK